jgi:arsenate reductase
VIGSGIAAQQLSPNDIGLQLFENAAATAGGLYVFALSAISISTHHRASAAHVFSEIIATGGLILVIFALARTRRSTITPAAVGAYIGAAYFFTSSASFANPAISIGRMFSNTFAGIAPASVPAYIAAQAIGGVAAILALRTLYPDVTPQEAATVLVPHGQDGRATEQLARELPTQPA